MATCEQCGEEVEGRFCSNCGATVGETSRGGGGGGMSRGGGGGPIAWPDDAEGAAHVFGHAIDAGTPVLVNSDEALVAIADGAVIGALGPGRQAMPRPVDDAVMVKRTPQQFRVNRTAALEGMSARIYGFVRFLVQDPTAFVSALSDHSAIHGEGLEQSVAESAGELAEQVLRSAMDDGKGPAQITSEWSHLLGLAAGKWPVPGTTIDLTSLEFSTGPAEEAEEGGSRGSSGDEQESDFVSLIGEEVWVTMPNGRRQQGTVEGTGYLVRFESGETRWVPLDKIELE